jgi:hypothetical protein
MLKMKLGPRLKSRQSAYGLPAPLRAANANDLRQCLPLSIRALLGFATVTLGKTAYLPFAEWAEQSAADRFSQGVVHAVTFVHGTSTLADGQQ